MSKQESCEQRLPQHLASRLAHFDALQTLVGLNDATDLLHAVEDQNVRDVLADIDPDTLELARKVDTTDGDAVDAFTDAVDVDDVRDAAMQARDELPLGVSPRTVFRVELSTGGPADWLEVICAGDAPRYAPLDRGAEYYEVERIVYHFADWFDHAERQLDGAEFDTAREFVSSVVPELVD